MLGYIHAVAYCIIEAGQQSPKKWKKAFVQRPRHSILQLDFQTLVARKSGFSSLTLRVARVLLKHRCREAIAFEQLVVSFLERELLQLLF